MTRADVKCKRNDEIVARYRAGGTYGEIVKEYGMSALRLIGAVEEAEKRAEDERLHRQTDHIGDVPIDTLNLSVRALYGLRLAGCKTVGDAMLYSDAALLALPDFGKASLRDWKQCFDDLRHEFDSRVEP